MSAEVLRSPSSTRKLLIILLTLLAFGLRVWALDIAPPGWRDDELINALVISQKVLDGDWAVYYPDASGHEALYHAMVALTLALFGPGTWGIRGASIILGTLTVPLTYLVAKRLYGWQVGLLAAAALALSFWSLMYSRIGIRHISLPLFVLATFYALWRGLDSGSEQSRHSAQPIRGSTASFLLAGLFMGLGFYTYFASRGVPIILLAFCGYLGLFQRPLLQRYWRGLLLTLGLAALLAVPLAVTLLRQPESEARVEELAVPLIEARSGNWQPLAENALHTLNMFHSNGDEEWLYNIPSRPVFGIIGALFFWGGVGMAAWYAAKPLLRLAFSAAGRRPSSLDATPHRERASAFLLIWWLVGISPAFVSVPPASLGHTILAQPAVLILAALPLTLVDRLAGARASSRILLGTALATLLILSIAWRDLPDYFNRWPERGMTRFLYRADIRDLARYLDNHPELSDFAVTGLLAGPWDRLALDIDLRVAEEVRPRWYNPERALFLSLAGQPALSFSGYPLPPSFHPAAYEPVAGHQAGEYHLARVEQDIASVGDPACFQNGLCLARAQYDPSGQTLELVWEVERPLDLPEMPLVSNPAPPGVYAGPRLLVFAQALDSTDTLLAGDDGLWVDVTTLHPGDRFVQQHRFGLPEGSPPATISFGLYDPKTGERIATTDGRDHLELPATE